MPTKDEAFSEPQPKKKVFCPGCKFLFGDFYTSAIERCTCPHNREKSMDPVRGQVFAKDVNANFDCPYYETRKTDEVDSDG